VPVLFVRLRSHFTTKPTSEAAFSVGVEIPPPVVFVADQVPALSVRWTPIRRIPGIGALREQAAQAGANWARPWAIGCGRGRRPASGGSASWRRAELAEKLLQAGPGSRPEHPQPPHAGGRRFGRGWVTMYPAMP
jgi:hypothetical protein